MVSSCAGVFVSRCAGVDGSTVSELLAAAISHTCCISSCSTTTPKCMMISNDVITTSPLSDDSHVSNMNQVLDLHRAASSCDQGGGGYIPTSLHELDATLHGGLARGTVTEVSTYSFPVPSLPTLTSPLSLPPSPSLPPSLPSSLQVAGPPGCGKTQLCLTLTMTTALLTTCGGCGLGVVYIDTEATFSAERSDHCH